MPKETKLYGEEPLPPLRPTHNLPHNLMALRDPI